MTHKPNISKNERSAASNRWRHAANIKHGLAIIAFVACILPASNLCGQNIAIKSNLLYDLTTTLNMGGEVRCDDTHTISLSLNYNPWNFGGNKKMKHFLLQPEYRKWFNEVFTGSFIGFQLHYALFNFGGMLPWGFNNGKMLGIENRQIAHNRYQGNLAGFGISYGYQWILAKHWNLEGDMHTLIINATDSLKVQPYWKNQAATTGDLHKQGYQSYISSDKST